MRSPKLLFALLVGLSSCARPVPAPEQQVEPTEIASDDDASFAVPPATDAGTLSPDAAVRPGPPDAATPSECPTKLEGKPGPCTLGDRCEVPDGVCFCDGYHGGIPPRPGVDHSHWACGRSRNRTDGCPDDIRAGARCNQRGQSCNELEGLFCGVRLECRRGTWVPTVDTCSTIP